MKFLMGLFIVLLVIGFAAAPVMACGHDCGNCDDADDCDSGNNDDSSECDGNCDDCDDGGDDDDGHGDCDGDSCNI